MERDFRKELPERMSRDWVITDPSGNVFEIRNLLKWCKENDVSYSTVYEQRKGWKCQKI